MPLNILVVDDILESRRDLCALVTELGHVAHGADSGRSALGWLEVNRPDLVLLDLLMPDVDGFMVIRQLRDQASMRWLPVIVTSSLRGEEHFIQALAHGADDYLVRPVSAGLLEAKLRHYGGVLDLQSRLATLLQRQRDILDNVLDPVITLDGQGQLMELNQAAHALCGVDGRPLARGMACREALGLPIQDLLTRSRIAAQRAGGQRFSAAVSLSQWRDDGQSFYTVVLHDLTDREKVDRMKDEFLATVSHELRTPLTSVLGALGLLAGGAAGALPAAAVPLAEAAQRNGQRLSHLIDDILDLTKLEGDRLILHPRPLALPDLLREALAANQGYAGRSGVRLVAEDLDLSDPPVLQLDGERFLQVMANLLSNAIKHSPAGESVRVIMCRSAGEAGVIVRDHGQGVDPAFRSRIFEKFSQADGTDRRVQGGTGLGLHIARMLVQRMGGRIGVGDAPGGGAAFEVWFPLAGADAKTADRVRTVLHVDSDFETRTRVAQWLSPICRVEGVSTLGQAAELARQRPLALFLANPQDQGAADAFCEQLKRIAGPSPIILFGRSVDAAFCARVGLPWLSPARSDENDLQAAVEHALSGAARTAA